MKKQNLKEEKKKLSPLNIGLIAGCSVLLIVIIILLAVKGKKKSMNMPEVRIGGSGVSLLSTM